MSQDMKRLSALVETARLKAVLTKKEDEYNTLVREAAGLRDQVQAMTRLEGARKRPVKAVRKTKGGKGDVEAVAVASDWHLEERIDPETVNGLNRYDLQTATQRTDAFFRQIVWLVEASKAFNLNRLHLAILGDIITGHLHPENVESNQLSPLRAAEFAFERLRAGITHLLTYTPQPLTVVCASGNHGRSIDKPRHSTRVQHSYENHVYRMLARDFASDTRVTFVLEGGYHVYSDVAGWPVRFHHGDGLKYLGGVGGLYVPAGKAIAQWNKARYAALDVFGHYHTMVDGGNFIANGSLAGYSAYGVSIKASYERPQQQFFLVDRKRGKVLTAPIFVD